MVERPAERERAGAADATVRRLHAHEPAVRRRECGSSRRCRIRSRPSPRRPRRRRRAAARAAGAAVEIPRVARRRRVDAAGEHVRGRLADENRARGCAAARRRWRPRRPEPRPRTRASRCRSAAPATSKMSLIAIGIPRSAPPRRPSWARASRSAPSASTDTKACSSGSTASSRSSADATSSDGASSPAAIRLAASTRPSSHGCAAASLTTATPGTKRDRRLDARDLVGRDAASVAPSSASSSSATALSRSGGSGQPDRLGERRDALLVHGSRSGKAANIFSTFSTKRTVASSIWSR